MAFTACDKLELVTNPDTIPPGLVTRYSDGQSALWRLVDHQDHANPGHLLAARTFRRNNGNTTNHALRLLVVANPTQPQIRIAHIQIHRLKNGVPDGSEEVTLGWKEYLGATDAQPIPGAFPHRSLVDSVTNAIRRGAPSNDPIASPHGPSGGILAEMIRADMPIHPAAILIANVLRPVHLSMPPDRQLPA